MLIVEVSYISGDYDWICYYMEDGELMMFEFKDVEGKPATRSLINGSFEDVRKFWTTPSPRHIDFLEIEE